VELSAVLREFPGRGGRVLDKAARGGFVDVVFALLDMGVSPIGNGGVYHDGVVSLTEVGKTVKQSWITVRRKNLRHCTVQPSKATSNV
jgi:hypothetical protein